MKAVIYARYSCDKQREESIEGQLRECKQYAEKQGYTVVGTYVDQAFSAKTDKRPEFQKMIKDSSKKVFDFIIVWKLDRFARNRYDSAKYKYVLRKNGIKVLSATEAISDGPEGIILESVLEGMAEYYSEDLAEKVTRGMTENAIEGLFNGGNLTFGYYIDENKKFQIDPVQSIVVKKVFELFADGLTMLEVSQKLTNEGYRNKNGTKITRSFVNRTLHNRRYIGEYRFRDVVNTTAIPPIISQALFDRVQKKMELNATTPQRHCIEEEYLLTPKLFCGKCGKLMVGESGTSASGRKYRYYKCVGTKRFDDCNKKAVKKDWIEDIVLSQVISLLFNDNFLNELADTILEVLGEESSILPMLRNQYQGVERSISNILKAIEQGIITDSTKFRLQELEEQKKTLYAQIVTEEMAKPTLTKDEILNWLNEFKKLNFNKNDHKRKIIDYFINAIYLYDDRIIFSFNYKDGLKTVTFEEATKTAFCSDKDPQGSPKSRMFIHSGFLLICGVDKMDINNHNELNRTYIPFMEWKEKSKQIEYTQPVPLLDEDGNLLARGWARKNVFGYDRNLVKKGLISRKEWDFYTIFDDRMQILVSFANINIGGYVAAKLTDLKTGKVICDSIQYFAGANKHVSHSIPDAPSQFKDKIGKTEFDFNTKEQERTLWYKGTYKGKSVEVTATMDIPEGLESITTIFPFDEDKTKYFMTTKQLCMPCEGKFIFGDYVYEFTKDKAFCSLDWGRVNTPHEMVWYWGSGSQYITDKKGERHLFGFEITWAIGNEENATETCLFYDGKIHKIGAVDVEKFPKDRFMEPWKFISEDGRFNMTMTPTLDNHSDVDFKVGRMNCHQVYGIWNGDVTLDDGTKLEIKDLFTFCEYVENRW